MAGSDFDEAEVVRAAFLASNRGDVDGFLECLDPRIEWEAIGIFLHPAGVSRGHDAVRSGFESRVEHLGRHPRVTLTEIEVAAPHVLVQGVLDAAGGQRLPEAWICEVHDGRVLRVAAFTSPGEGAAEWNRRIRSS